MIEKYIFYLLRKSFQSSYLLYKFFSHRQFLLRIIMGPTCSICQRQSVPGSLSSDSLSSPPPTFHWFQTTYSKSIILWITTQVIRSNWKVFWIFTFIFTYFTGIFLCNFALFCECWITLLEATTTNHLLFSISRWYTQCTL